MIEVKCLSPFSCFLNKNLVDFQIARYIRWKLDFNLIVQLRKQIWSNTNTYFFTMSFLHSSTTWFWTSWPCAPLWPTCYWTVPFVASFLLDRVPNTLDTLPRSKQLLSLIFGPPNEQLIFLFNLICDVIVRLTQKRLSVLSH